MTGATAVVWFLSRKKTPRPKANGVKMVKTEAVREAQRAVQESAERQQRVSQQRGIVNRVAASLAEVRKANHFAENIRSAMGGDK